MESRTTKGISIRTVRGNARRDGFPNSLTNGNTNGLTNTLNGRTLRKSSEGEKKHGKILAIAVLGFLVLGVFAVLAYQSQQKNTTATEAFAVEPIARDVQSSDSTEIKGTAHAPIYINGNADFAAQASANGWTGDGTQGNPYIMEGYDIINTAIGGASCIWIENTSVWFVIRNCNLRNAWTGIYLKNVTHGTLANNNCSGNSCSILLWYSSSNNIITNNNCSDNKVGICLDSSSNNNTITNNNCSDNSQYGISLSSSSSNTITNNNCSGNSQYGISLSSSSSNTITNNNCSGNGDGIRLDSSTNNNITNNTLWNNGIVIDGGSLAHWNTQIIENNTVNGKPVYYYKNLNGGTVPPDVGQVILANCTNMVVSGLTLTHASIGVQLGYSSYNNITNNNCSDNKVGIYLSSSSNNFITNNNCSGNSQYGIYLSSSSNNFITNNNCSGNSQYGISLSSSSSNTITNNNCSNNSRYGIYLWYSNSNTITNNNCSDNSHDGILLWYSSSNNIITNNNCSDNSHDGILLGGSSNNTIMNNNCSSNSNHGILLNSSCNNTITSNNCSSNSNYGILLDSSSNNTITNNNCSSNSKYGMFLRSSSSNTICYNNFYLNTNYAINITSGSTGNIIHHNNFWQNNGVTSSAIPYSQAVDYNGKNLWYDIETKEGNYWSNWDGNGWSTPYAYPIDGGAGAYDRYPLKTPVGEQQHGNTPGFDILAGICAILASMAVIAIWRRKSR